MRTALGLLAVAPLLLAACGEDSDDAGPAGPHVPVKFAAVAPAASGFSFLHELPGGLLDNLPKAAMGGVALIDYDGDGKVDVFCVNGGWDDHLAGISVSKPERPAKCRLFHNLGAMRFEDVTEKAGVGFEGFALGACVGDFDGDGRPDLFVSAYGRPALYRNRGDGTFEEVAAKAGIAPGLYAGAAFLDYDRDGVLDLFASQYVDPSELDLKLMRSGDFAGPGYYKPQPARLWHGRGDGTFEDVTAKAGVGTPGKGMGVLATDVDGDGWIDVIVANDTEANFVWRNQGDGTFADAAARLGMAFGLDGEARASMGVTAADLNADGRLDYLIPDTSGGDAYVAGERFFRDRASDWGLVAATFKQTGWADVAFDADNDGRVDVWKTHGSLRDASDLQWPKLVMNRGPAGPDGKGGMIFEYLPPPPREEYEGAEAHVIGRGGVAADFDDDGREDLLLMSLNAPAHLFRNVTEGGGHWVRIRLAGKARNTMALGARVTGRAGKLKVVQEVSGSTGYISAPDARLHFGLGGAKALTEVVVRWPNGKEQRVGDLAAGRDHVIEER